MAAAALARPDCRLLPFRSGGRDYVVACDAVVAVVPVVGTAESATEQKWILLGRARSGLRAVYADAVGEPMHAEDADLVGDDLSLPVHVSPSEMPHKPARPAVQWLARAMWSPDGR